MKTAFRLIDLVVIFVMTLGSPLGALAAPLAQDVAPTIASDVPDYAPGALVTLTGTGWFGDTTVAITVDDDLGKTWYYTDRATVETDGTVADSFNLPTQFVAQYFVKATGVQTGRVATAAFTDAQNPSANLDQCANDQSPSSNTDGCNSSATQWVNGNLGASKSLYLEGDSIPYRLRFDALSTGTHTVTFRWDTTKAGKHALDYLTTYNASVLNANPCLGVTGCNPADGNPFDIPADPQVTGAGVTPISGVFTMFGGTITAVSAYSYPDGPGFDGDKTAQITITFTTNISNPVLAWGGHISTRKDWGASGAAVAIPGSPYHTSLMDLDGSGGNQDRSLSADAVIFPGSITIIKDATPNGSTSFDFTASPSPLANFSLVDDGTSSNTKVFSNIITFQTYTVTENVPSGWQLDSASCTMTSPNGGSQTVSGAIATINLKEGENVTCTFSNSLIPVYSLNVTKSSTTTEITAAGQVVPYTFVVTNTGNMPLTGITVTDPNCDAAPALQSGDANNDGKLDLSETWTYGCSHTVTQAEIDSNGGGDGDLDNTVTADSNETGPDTADYFIPITLTAALTLDKSVTSSEPYDSVGDVITYSLVATNTGNVTLHNVSISDPKLGALTCTQPVDLVPGATLTCTGSHTVTLADLDAGSYYNIATADSTETEPVTDDVTVPMTVDAALTLDKTVTSSSPYDSAGDVITYSLVATNTGNVTLHNVSISDPKLGTLTCTQPVDLAPGATLTCTASHTVTQGDLDAGSYYNIATADSTETEPVTDDVTVPMTVDAALTLLKTATPSTYDEVGDVISYSYKLTNSGNVTLSGPFTVTDDKATVTCPATASLAPNAFITCTASYTISQADLDAGFVTNVAMGHGFFGTTPVDSNEDTETVNADQTKSLTLLKTATPSTYDEVGDVISYSYKLTNSGNVTLSGPFTVTDDKATVTCPATASLAPNAFITCTASYTISQADLDAGFVTNVAMGHGFFGTTPVDSNEDTETVDADQKPALTLDKSVTSSEPYDSVGDVITYSLVAKNTGNITLHNVSISDPKLGALSCKVGSSVVLSSSVDYASLGFTLAPGETLTCTGSHAVTQDDLDAGSYYNIATADSDETNPPVTDEVTVPLVQTPALTLDKTASPTTYDAVDDVISYSYLLTNTGNVTLSGPFTVTDDKATVSCPATDTLAPLGTITCTASYTIQQDDLDAGSVTNIAKGKGFFGTTPVESNEDTETVTAVQKPALTLLKTATPATYDEVGDVISYSYNLTNSGNVTLSGPFTVTDDKATVTCPATVSLAPMAFITCTASYTIAQGDLDAGSVINTAMGHGFFGNTPVNSNQDSETVTADQNPSIDIVKLTNGVDGLLIPVGDPLTWTYKVTNTGNVTLTNVTVTDDKLANDGTVIDCGGVSPNKNVIASLAPAAFKTCTATGVAVVNGYANIGTATGTPPVGGNVSDNDSSSYYGSQPSIDIVKTTNGYDELYIPVGAAVTWNYEVTNTGNVDLTGIAVSDSDLGPITCPYNSLIVGASMTCTATGTAVAGPYANTGSVTGTPPLGGGGDVSDSDDSSYFGSDPSITIDKKTNGDDGLSILAGQPITWTYLVTNTGNVTLTNVTVTDDKLANDGTVIDCGGVSPNKNVIASLAPAASKTCTATGTAVANLYENTGTASGKPPVGDNVTDSDDSSYFGADPQINIVKVTNGSDGPALMLGSAITWTYTVTNVGNVTLSNVTVTDSKNVAVSCPKTALAVAESMDCTATGIVTTAMLTGNAYSNIGTASGTYTDDKGASRTDTASDTSSFTAYGLTELLKLTSIGGSTPAVDPSMTWTFSIYAGPHGAALPGSGSAWLGSDLASSNTSGDLDGILEFGDYELDPSKTYTICELSVPSGYTVEWKVDTNGDGTPDLVVVPFNPNQKDAVPGDLGNRCFDFGAGTSYTLPANGLLVWQVINSFPGGEPRTPGYWKNWNRCTGGGQAANADRNGGRAKGFTLLEDILTSPGITWDDIANDNFGPVQITSCEQAVEILDQRVVTLNGIVGDGKKIASDAARTLAMHLLAAQLNAGNGACINQNVNDVMLAAEKLLDSLNFDGKKSTAYITSKSANYAYALTLAKYLDAYNNSACNFNTLPPKPTLK